MAKETRSEKKKSQGPVKWKNGYPVKWEGGQKCPVILA